MKTNKKFFIICLSAFLFSCSNEYDYLPIAPENPIEDKVTIRECCFIDFYEALYIANQFLDLRQETETRALSEERILRESSIIQSDRKTRSGDATSDTLMYVFNFNEGFTVVSATRNIHMQVLAYSTEGGIVIDDPGNIGLSIWMDMTKAAVEKSIEKQIDTFAHPVEESEVDMTTRSAVFFNEIRNHRRVGPLVTPPRHPYPYSSRHWHQHPPFNNHVPILFDGVRALAGCVPVAIAQVVNFHRRLDGHNIDWEAIGEWEASAKTNLIRVISRNVEMLYLPGGTSPMVCVPNFFCYRDRIVNFLNRSGYIANFVNLGTNLGNQRPTTLPAIYEGFTANFIGGTNWFGGHWWVLDGYERWERWYGWGHFALRAYLDPGRPGTPPPPPPPPPGTLHPPLSVTGFLFLHFNWGWYNGRSNGWFGVNSSYLDYSRNLRRLDIRPR